MIVISLFGSHLRWKGKKEKTPPSISNEFRLRSSCSHDPFRSNDDPQILLSPNYYVAHSRLRVIVDPLTCVVDRAWWCILYCSNGGTKEVGKKKGEQPTRILYCSLVIIYTQTDGRMDRQPCGDGDSINNGFVHLLYSSTRLAHLVQQYGLPVV